VRQAAGTRRIPENCLFSLLADVRLAKASYSQELRVPAIENRLSELVTILCGHPSLQEITSAYFQAQPELMLELIDLLCPKVSSASSVSAAAARPTENDDELQCGISALANSLQSSLRCKKFGNRSIDGTC
jgi:hypothetical protein